MKITKITGVLLCLVLLLSGCAAGRQAYPLDASRIQADTVFLCEEIGIRPAGSEAEAQARRWIQESLEAAGFTGDNAPVCHSFSAPDGSLSENVIAICNPDCPTPLFSIVAHYDSVESSPGARDNAASVAALLEIARYLGSENAAFPCQIRMVFLGSEENGYHGSKAYVDSLTPEERSRHEAAFNMDISAASDSDKAVLVCNTLGKLGENGYEEGNFLFPARGELVNAVDKAYKRLYGKSLGGVFHFGESDHVSFHNAGLEAANICWRRVTDGDSSLPESYHKPSDTPGELNYETIRSCGRCILCAISILCQRDG